MASGPTSPPTRITAAALQGLTLPQTHFVIPGILPAGLTIFAGRPKDGKSVLALNMSLASASGEVPLGIKTLASHPVLFLGLEDSLPRLQARIHETMGTLPWPSNLELITRLADPSEAIPLVQDFLQSIRPAPGLVIIDTLQMIRTDAGIGKDLYAKDYAALTPLRTLAQEHNSAVVAIHHLRKQETFSPLDSLSGTMAISGVADTIWIMQRSVGVKNAATLHVTGRDVETKDFELRADPWPHWKIVGEVTGPRLSREYREVIEALGNAKVPVKRSDLMMVLSIPVSAEAAFSMRLKRMVKQRFIQKTSHGCYALP